MVQFSRRRIRARWLQGALMTIAGVISLGLLIPIWLDVTNRLDEMQISRRDNVIWTLAQLDVEFLELEKAALNLQISGDEALPELYRRFNVFYSRVGTLRQSPLYRNAIIEAGEIEALERTSAGLESVLPLMDGPSDQLLSHQEDLQSSLAELRPNTRRIVTNASFVLSSVRESARKEAADLVTRLGIASLVLFGSLFGLAFLFSRLYVIYKLRATENLLTTQRLATVIETSPDAIVVTDTEGRVQEFNSAASRLLGYPVLQALGMDFSSMLRDQHGQSVKLPIQSRAVFRQRMCGRSQDGITLPLEVSQGATSLAQRPVYVYFLRDITERLRAEEALKASLDKAVAGEQAKAHFLAVMSHEMRTPLNGILGIVELLRDSLNSERNRHYLSVLERSGKVLLEHVNEVLDLTEIEARGITLNMAPFHLDKMLDEITAAMRPSAEAKGNELTLTRVPAQLGYFEGDAMRLRQVLANLLSNAIKFTQNGRVELMVASQPGDTGTILEIQVIDTGFGIAEAQQHEVFDDFFRAHDGNSDLIEGTGLGLGIVRRIVMAMQGEIGVESIPGEGSLFWVHLPMVPVNARTLVLTEPLDPNETQATGLRVLLIEDNQTNRFVLKEMLEQGGQTVREAENGSVGVELARAEAFDVILMDINMPVMGGVAATRAIRSSGLNQKTRIVALTAHILDQDAQLYREVGMDAVVSKPISRRNLRAILSGPLEETVPERRTATLDRTILNQLSETMPAQRVLLVVEGAISEGDAFVDKLKRLSTQSREDLLVEVHNLSGTAAMIGAIRLRNMLARLETKLRAQGGGDLNIWADALRILWGETRADLVEYAGMTSAPIGHSGLV